MENRIVPTALIVTTLVLGSLISFISIVPPAKAVVAKTGDVNNTKEGWSTMNMVWDSNTATKPIVMNLSINKGWSIESATMGITGAPYITDPGTPWEVWNYPERPRLDVGHHGDDWVWSGTMGHQSNFANDSQTEEQTYSAKDTQYLYVPLPVGAQIQDIKIDVNNTQSGQYEYKMSVGNDPSPVWYKSSIGFSKGPTIPTFDIGGTTVGINTVCIEQLDFTSAYKGIVAAGSRGNFFIYLRNKDLATGYDPNTKPIAIGIPDQRTNQVPDILHCALADFNQDVNNELALSTTDGRIYVLTQDGMGHFVYPTTYMINSSQAASRMESVTFGDINGDGWGDVIGGYTKGQYYVATFDNTKDKFNAPYVVRAASGALNDISAIDLNSDQSPDLVGASADRSWWTVKNTGSNKPATQWADGMPVRSGGSALTSLAVTDLNWDQSPDLVSGSVDGSFYVAYNIGGTFDPTQVHSIRGALESMKSVAAGDLDLDGSVDIVGLSGDGWLYAVKNNFGNLEDGRKLIQVGQDQSCIALGDLNNDNALDIAVGGSKGITLYYNNLGPFAQTIGVNDSGALKNGVQKFLNMYHAAPEDYDAYGNLVVDVPLKISATYAGSLKFDRVNVTYTYKAKPDLKTAVDLYIRANTAHADAKGFITVPVEFRTDSMGKLLISDINIHYKETLQSIIDFPTAGADYNISTTITLQGRSNFDPTCKDNSYTYTWFVDGRVLGSGCSLKVYTGTDLGGVGTHNIRLTVKNTATGESDSNNIPIYLVLPKEPNLRIWINLDSNAKYFEDKTIKISITVQNTGAINATNIGIILNENRTEGNRRIGSTNVPNIPAGGPKQNVTIEYKTTSGMHKLCTSVSPPTRGQTTPCVQIGVQKKPQDPTIFAIILIIIIVMALVGYFGIRYAQSTHERRAKKEREEMEEKLRKQMQADFADIYGPGGAAPTTDPNAQYGTTGYGSYDQYGGQVGGVSGYGDVSPTYQTYKCPRCGQPTTELGVQCFACDAKDSVKYAEEAIKEVKELGIDVDEADALLAKAKESLKAGNHEVALEQSEEAEDMASETKERYDKAFSMISAEGAETAAERRKKRLERRRAAREKKDKLDTMGGGAPEGGGEADGGGAPPEGQ